GDSYLPRKFKIGVALDTDNSIDVFTNDASFLAITEDDGQGGRETIGYNLNVGGGFGMTHNKADTIARIATPIVFVPKDRAVEAMRTVVAIFRDHGNRSDRRAARIKYLLEAWGVEKFRAEFEARFGPAEDPRDTPRPFQFDHLGRHDQGDGKQWVGVYIPSGRIVANYKNAFRELVTELRPGVTLTASQSILFTDLTPEQADRAEAILSAHDLPLVETLSGARRYHQACVALPTCGLALTDAERALPGVIDHLEGELEPLGLRDVPMTVRMTGCPNGCARPYNADIGLVGRKPGVYHLFVGGGLSGDRVADLFAADVPVGEITATLRPLLERFAEERDDDEGLSDFYRRIKGETDDRKLICGKETPTGEEVLAAVVV
ncbi:MAG: NADPH-dependent assimilatory sulfite reductase hemoprotein subunit, partial [Planctomycetota bacterium]